MWMRCVGENYYFDTSEEETDIGLPTSEMTYNLITTQSPVSIGR